MKHEATSNVEHINDFVRHVAKRVVWTTHNVIRRMANNYVFNEHIIDFMRSNPTRHVLVNILCTYNQKIFKHREVSDVEAGTACRSSAQTNLKIFPRFFSRDSNTCSFFRLMLRNKLANQHASLEQTLA